MKNLLTLIVLLSTITVYGQAIYKKGYIVNLESDTIKGFVLLTESQKYYSEVTFKATKKEKAKLYTTNEIKAYGYGNKSNFCFESCEMPLIKKDLIVEGSKKRTFLKILATSGSYILYTTYYNREKAYYLKNLKISESDLIPITLAKSNAEQYKVSEGVYQINGETFNVTEGTKLTSNNNKNFLFKEGILYEIIPAYQNELRKIAVANNCDLEERIKETRLSSGSLSGYFDDLHKCINTPLKFSNGRLHPQISILAIGSTKSYTRKIHYGYEKGLLLEVRENAISPNFSFSLGYSQTDYSSTFYKVFEFPNGDRFINVLSRIEGNSLIFKLNYHFFAGSNLRPYIAFNNKNFNFENQLRSYYEPHDEISRTTMKYNVIGGAIGLDFYFLKYLQMRAEVGYTGNVLEYQLGLGVVIR